MRSIWVFFGAAFLLLIASCGTKELRVQKYQLPSDSPDPAKFADEFYVIGPGDLLEIVVWKEPTLSGPVKVRPDGFVTLALVNEVRAAGLTTAQLRKTLEQKYADFVSSPFVTIRVTNITSSEIFVIGQVAKPAPYPASGNDTVLQMLSRAGGLTLFANPHNIKVARREGNQVTEYVVDYDAILNGDLKQDIVLRPGDRIIVP
jgi:polysaccharide export outer membrane protein